MLSQPCIIINIVLRHRLLHHHNPLFFQPVNHIQSIPFISPPLICINSQRQICNRSYSLNHSLIIGPTHFNFQDIKSAKCLLSLLAHHIIIINSDSECSIGHIIFVHPIHLIPWRANYLACQIVQSNINGGLCRSIINGNTVNILKYLFHLCRVCKPRQVHFLQKLNHRSLCFAKIWRQRSFAISHQSVILQSGENNRRSFSRKA